MPFVRGFALFTQCYGTVFVGVLVLSMRFVHHVAIRVRGMRGPPGVHFWCVWNWGPCHLVFHGQLPLPRRGKTTFRVEFLLCDPIQRTGFFTIYNYLPPRHPGWTRFLCKFWPQRGRCARCFQQLYRFRHVNASGFTWWPGVHCCTGAIPRTFRHQCQLFQCSLLIARGVFWGQGAIGFAQTMLFGWVNVWFYTVTLVLYGLVFKMFFVMFRGWAIATSFDGG